MAKKDTITPFADTLALVEADCLANDEIRVGVIYTDDPEAPPSASVPHANPLVAPGKPGYQMVTGESVEF